jgi:predicted HTH domain antitoxin
MYTYTKITGMDMELITFRAEKKLAKELAELQRHESLDRSSAARKAFELGINEWKKQEAIRLILQGKLSLGRAAEILGIPLYGLLELLRERKVDFISMTAEDMGREATAAKRR